MSIHTLFDSLEAIAVSCAEGVRPAERLTVSEAAVRYRKLQNIGSYTGDWTNEMTPYLVEPMDCMSDELYSTVCFVGPAQCGKTDMFLNYQTYTVRCDPADLMLVQTAQGTARDFSITRIDRLHRHSPEVGERLISRRDADNTYDKQYTSGIIVRIGWPSINELSGRPVPRMFLTDYDRMDQDVDGEGSPFMLAQARTTTFGRFGKTIVESSPGFLINDPQWIPTSRHQAPPTSGILSIYNAGDRRRWYWRCVDCKKAFEPHRSLLSYPNSKDAKEAAELAHMVCPHCSQKYHHHQTDVPSKHEMNQLAVNGGHARWLKDGQFWQEDDTITGDATVSSGASFWLMGVAAAFSNWSGLVESLLNAEKEYEETGVENSLKTVINTKFGEPYMLKAQATARLPDVLKSRSKDYGLKVVPHGVRFLIASIDVQKNRFVVQVHGVGAEDIWIVDRYEVKYSKREQEDAPGQMKYINPGAHPEDWRLLVPEVLMKSYPLADDPERHMAVMHTFCDSGGREGVTANAYEFVRWLRQGYEESVNDETKELYPWHPQLAARFQLIKGEPLPNAPRIRLGYPDSQRKDRNAGARGEIPVLFLNSNALKDWLDKILDRVDPGGRVNFPNWLPTTFYKELTVEVKDKKTGKWENPNKYRNESWDLLVYCLAGLLHRVIAWEHINWDIPPLWAAEWESNELVFRPDGEEDSPFDVPEDDGQDLAALGALLG